MKKTNYYTVIFCGMFMFWASILKSQDIATVSTANEKWHPIKISETSNELNGISFFSREAICNGKQIILIRLSNSNLSAANVSYVENEMKKSVVVAPSSIMEGTCELLTDANEKNTMSPLVYSKPLTDREKTIRKRLLASLKVTVEK